MSELKAITAYEANFKITSYGDNGVLVYLKSAADKVIADLEESHKKEVKQLLILNREQANAANRLRDSMEQTLRHQKHKRCLTMARWCAACRFAWSFMPDGDEVKAECEFYEKWKRRWEALAKEPTWAKFLQLIHKEK